MAVLKYGVDYPEEKIIQLKEIIKEIFSNDIEKFKESQIEFRKEVMNNNPSKLWCKYKVRIRNYETRTDYLVETIGFIQVLFFSTGKARVSDPLKFFGSGDITEFEVLNPENLKLVLSDMGKK